MSVKYLALEYPDVRRTLGFRIWLAQGAVSFKEGRVVSVSLAEVVEGQNEWLGAQWKLLPEIPEDRLKSYREVGSFRPEMDRLMPKATRYRRQHDCPPLGWNSGSWGPQDRSCE